MRSIRTPARRTAAASAELDRIVEPKSGEEFLAEDWERQPLVVQRDEAGRFDDLLSVADVEELVCSSGIRYPAFRLVREGEQIPLSSYTVDIPWSPRGFTGTAEVQRVVEEFEAGATIVLQGLHHHWLPLAEFCRGLEASLGHPVQANAYYTPRGSQGLAVHHDTHDVFVLQVSGEKRWLVYEPAFELPLRDQKYKRERHGGPGPAVHDLTLGAGHVLYLPRGWLHEALTSGTDSLHITVGINVYTWIEAARAAVEACADDVEFRRAVPDDGEPTADLLARLTKRLDPEQVCDRRGRRFLRARRPVLGGQIRQVRALDDLDVQTDVERRPTVIADLEENGDGGVTITYEGKSVSFPPQATEAVMHCLEASEPFTPEDLPGDLDEPSRLVLVRRLVREGFLRISGQGLDGRG
jgi:bifunctional lysine-specific demethylase and histidyl-hydroxylase NO66